MINLEVLEKKVLFFSVPSKVFMHSLGPGKLSGKNKKFYFNTDFDYTVDKIFFKVCNNLHFIKQSTR